jgi:hypothetical protein
VRDENRVIEQDGQYVGADHPVRPLVAGGCLVDHHADFTSISGAVARTYRWASSRPMRASSAGSGVAAAAVATTASRPVVRAIAAVRGSNGAEDASRLPGAEVLLEQGVSSVDGGALRAGVAHQVDQRPHGGRVLTDQRDVRLDVDA